MPPYAEMLPGKVAQTSVREPRHGNWNGYFLTGTKPRQRGITLIEMVVVVTIISLIVAITLPAVTSGLDSLRLHQAVRDVVSLFDAGLSRAERSQQVVEISISQHDNALWIDAPDAHYERRIELPEGVAITRVLPEIPGEDESGVRSFLLYPGGTVPRFGVEMRNRRGVLRMVSVDSITGVPRISIPEEQPNG